MSTCCEIALRWIPQNTFDDKSPMFQVKVLCRQATRYYLSQWQPRSMSPYGVTMHQMKTPCWIVLSTSFSQVPLPQILHQSLYVYAGYGSMFIGDQLNGPGQQCLVWYQPRRHIISNIIVFMMTSSNGNIFRVTGHLCGELTGSRWIPHTKASDAELWCFLWSAAE